MSSSDMLYEIISNDVNLHHIEPSIYSVYSTGNSPGVYDSAGVSMIYDVVIFAKEKESKPQQKVTRIP